MAFVSESSSWRILDISNPLNPTVLTQPLSLQTTATHFFHSENQVIVTGANWVNVYDISNMDDIILTSSTGINYSSSADMVGETLYIGVGYDNPHVDIYSVTNGSLQHQGVVDLQSLPVDMEDFQVMEDGRILVWGNHKIQVVPSPCSWSEPAKQQPTNSQTIITASPNPFNPQTTLIFTLPRSGFCNLDIYDLRGRLVQQLWSGNAQEGDQKVLWQGKDEEGQSVPSGIYFARLVYEGGVANQKIVLLK